MAAQRVWWSSPKVALAVDLYDEWRRELAAFGGVIAEVVIVGPPSVEEAAEALHASHERIIQAMNPQGSTAAYAGKSLAETDLGISANKALMAFTRLAQAEVQMRSAQEAP